MIEIIRYLTRHKIRTALTILAVSVGIFAVTTVGGIAERMEAIIGDAETGALSRIYVWPKQFDRPLTENTLRQLRKVQGVAGVTATISDNLEKPEEGQVQIYFNPATFSGTYSDIPGLEYEPAVKVGLWAGRIPAPGSRTETVVSWDIAQEYGLEVGDEFVIRDRPFRVVGIFEHVASVALRTAYISYEMAERLATPNPFLGVGMVSVVPLPGTDLEELAARIEREVMGVEAQSPKESVEQARQQVLIFSLILGASGVMALLIGTFTIVNTMVVTVHEQRREIGLKKALGAADSHILAEVVTQAAFIGGIGGLVGVLAGIGVTYLANRMLFEYVGMNLFLVTPRLAVGAIVFTVLMGVCAGLYPAWQAARLDPVVALRGGGGVVYAARGLSRLIYLVRRNARSILTVGGIAIGIFALVALGSLAEYINSFMESFTASNRGKVLLQPEDRDVPFGRSTVGLIRRIPGVYDVVLSSGSATIKEEESRFTLRSELFYGVEGPLGEYGFDTPVNANLAEGRHLQPGSLNEVVIGAELARKYHLKVGDIFTIRDRDFTVVGIWERVPYEILSGFNLRAYVSLEAIAAALKQPPSIASITVLVAPGYDAQSLASAIEEEFPGIRTEIGEAVAAEVRRDFVILIAVMVGVLSIAVFVGGISVVNTMVIAVSERIREIGLKKAVGAADGDILAEVLADAGKLGGIGGIVGVLLAWPLVLLVNFITLRSTGSTILEMTPRLVVGSVIFCTFLGMVAGLLPAWRAARLDPVEALRTE
ncbi:MAG: ABC transporter permease [Anaerolineae bacterium]|nr:ABC transporter permease [Anaerolineae bacterium]